MEASSSPDDREVLQEQELARNGGLNAMSTYNQKVIERKEAELRELVISNYSRIREVERELSQLQLQVKLTAGPKKQAMEMLRKKIETQNEVVVTVRQRYIAAKQTLASLEAELKREEEEKDRLCNELNTLIQQSTNLQLSKLDELRQHLELLNHGFAPGTAVPPSSAAAAVAGTATTQTAGAAVPPQPQPVQQLIDAPMRVAAAAAEEGPATQCTAAAPETNGASAPATSQTYGTQTAAGAASGSQPLQLRDLPPDPAAAAAAAAARSRHVPLGGAKTGRSTEAATAASRERGPRPVAHPAATALSAGAPQGRFLGFDT